MVSRFQKFKFQVVAPTLIGLLKAFLGDRNQTGDACSSQEFLFILGSGRNGSTLISTILNQHKELCVLPEQYLIPFQTSQWQIKRWQSKERFIDQLAVGVQRPDKTMDWGIAYDEVLNLFRQGGKSSMVSIESIFREIYLLYSHKKGKANVRYLGEKSPLNTHYLRIIEPNFPGAKYMFMMRDPRDVVLSYSRLEGHAAQNIHYAIWKWMDSARQYEWLRKKGHNPLMIKYEDLVADPIGQANFICDFLGISKFEKIDEQSRMGNHMGVKGQMHHQNLKKPINADSVGGGAKTLSYSHLTLIYKELGALARKYGYILEKPCS
ncbi:MAG: sulfotransferase [Cyclobacteriaceae bacterium]